MPYAAKPSELAEFQCLLIGSWSNDPDKVKDDKIVDQNGGPLSFNVMPLPQIPEQDTRPADQQRLEYPELPPAPAENPIIDPGYGGFVLKNFTFTETIRFNGANLTDNPMHRDPAALAIIAGAPNRGGGYTQFSHAVFYDQQVRFAEGPEGPTGALVNPANKAKGLGNVVHVENGAWLHLQSQHQHLGPYLLDKKNGPWVYRTKLPQPPYITIAKQIAVPHGNSVLALGNFDIVGSAYGKPIVKFPGAPAIPDAFVPYPAPADIITGKHTNPYDRVINPPADYENSNPEWTWNANEPLQIAVKKINPTSFIHWQVTTLPLPGGNGIVTNIPFEDRKAKVTEYWADYWLLSTDPKFDPDHPEKNDDVQYDYLVYNQTILMEMDIFVGVEGKDSIADPKSFRRYVFPHVTSNTVKRIGSDPAQGRHLTGGCDGCAAAAQAEADAKAAAEAEEKAATEAEEKSSAKTKKR
jgi:hypothetical protein